mgnify:CR=1 FL=1
MKNKLLVVAVMVVLSAALLLNAQQGMRAIANVKVSSDRDHIHNAIERFLGRVESHRLPVIAGIWPLTSHRNAEFLHNEVPGVSIPETLRRRMAEAGEGPAAAAEGARLPREDIEIRHVPHRLRERADVVVAGAFRRGRLRACACRGPLRARGPGAPAAPCARRRAGR